MKTSFSAAHVILRPEFKVILHLKSVKLHTVSKQLQLIFRWSLVKQTNDRPEGGSKLMKMKKQEEMIQSPTEKKYRKMRSLLSLF